MNELLAIAIVAITVLGVACQWLAWWLKLPAILFLLLTGILLGPAFGLLRPDALFGEMLLPLVSLGVAVVLFEGSLGLELHQVRNTAGVVRNLATVGVVASFVITAAGTRWALGLDWEPALLFAAIVVVTGPTVITPLLRTMRPTADIANVLRWEGIIVDPLGAVLALLVFEFVVAGHEGSSLMTFVRLFIVGLIAGLLGAGILAVLLRRHLLPGYLVNVATLALVLFVFAAANLLQEESGLLAVTIMGVALANIRGVPVEEIIDFKESLSVMIISGLFIVLAARIEFGQLTALGWGVAGVLAIILFVARPVAVLLSTWRSSLTWRERTLLGWIAPRGIVAAAVASLFAVRMEVTGVPGGEWLVPLTFSVIIATVVLHSSTGALVARWLGVSEPEPKGLLIVGANRAARAVARALRDAGFRTVLADSHWEDVRTARMDGLETYYGNAVSEHADRHLDLVGVASLLAMTGRPEFNALACTRYRNEFGANRVFGIGMPDEPTGSDKKSIARPFACTRLFGKDVTFAKLGSLLSQGAEIHTTLLTEDFGFDDYWKWYRGRPIPLFALDPHGRLHVFTAGDELRPEPGWSMISMLPRNVLEGPEEAASKGAL